jgi:stage II sporulation protein D
VNGSRVTARAYSAIEDAALVVARPRAGATLRLMASGVSRAYRGELEVTADGRSLRLVNVLSLEDYIPSVVPLEYPFQEIEGVKAQTILVRTYALRSRGRFDTHDLVDHVLSQVYRGIESETPLSLQAAARTRGEILTFESQPIEAVYSSSSGGHTADNETVWNGPPRPYLRGRADPYDHISPLHRWNETVDRRRLLQALSRAYGFQVTGFSIASTSPEGRTTRIRLHGSRELVEQANAFRLKLNEAFGRQVLRSTFFTVQRQGERYVFTGRGFGHGVGMSQFGARQQAILGRTYGEILSFYYQGAVLERWYPVGGPVASLAESDPRPAETPTHRPLEPAADAMPEEAAPSPVQRPAPTQVREKTHRVGW